MINLNDNSNLNNTPGLASPKGLPVSSSSSQKTPVPPPLDLNLFSPQQLSYWEMIRYFGKADLSALEKKIQELSPYRQPKEAQLLAALEKQDWEDPIFQENYCLYALTAFQEGKLTKNQIATLSHYWKATTYHTVKSEVHPIPLFTAEGAPNPEAWELMKLILPPSWPLVQSMEEEMKKLFERMKKAPVSEQQLFVYKMEAEDLIDPMLKRLEEIKFHLFTRVPFPPQEKEEKTHRPLPSSTLMQETLYLLYGNQAVEIEFILGNCSSMTPIANNAIHHQRIMSFHFPYIQPLPEVADSLEAAGTHFTLHDFYHAYVASAIPPAHRQAFARAFNLVEDRLEKTQKNQEYAFHLKDMEMTMYLPTHDWKEIMHPKPGETLPSLSEIFWSQLIHTCDFDSQDETGVCFITILIDYFHHEEDWKREFGIEIQPETQKRIFRIVKKTISNISAAKLSRTLDKLEKGWMIIDTARQLQSLIQKGEITQAQQIMNDLSLLIMSGLEFSYFFAAFSDKTAFIKMLQLFPTDQLILERFTGCQILDDDAIQELVKKDNYTSSLDLSYCRNITGKSLEILSQSKYNDLNLSGCYPLFNALHHLAKSPHLTLRILNTKQLKDQHLENLKDCKGLKHLHLDGSRSLTDQGLLYLSHVPNLESVSLVNCTQITQEGVMKLMRMKNLKNIFLRGCSKLDAEALIPVVSIAKERNIQLFSDALDFFY